MANYLELDINSGIIQQKNPISAGDAEVAEDTTNAGKVVQTNANGKIDNSLFEHDTEIKNLNVLDTFSFFKGESYSDWSISSNGNIYAYGTKIESFSDNTRYDLWDGDSNLCVNFNLRKLLPRSEDIYPASLDWSDENFLKTRGIDDLEGMNWGFFARTDFSSGSTNGRGFFDAVNVSNGTVSTIPVDPSANDGCFCYLALITGTSAAGAAQARGNLGFQLNSSFCEYEWGARVKIPILSTSTEEFSVQIGIQSSQLPTNLFSTRNHIIFHNDRATYGDSNWRAITRTASDTGTITDTGVAASTSAFQKLYFKFDQDNSAARVRFYIAGNLVATHTTNIPVSAGIHPRAAILKTVGTTPREIYMDYMWHKMKFLSRQSRV
jgi:hypothetical protein